MTSRDLFVHLPERVTVAGIAEALTDVPQGMELIDIQSGKVNVFGYRKQTLVFHDNSEGKQ